MKMINKFINSILFKNSCKIIKVGVATLGICSFLNVNKVSAFGTVKKVLPSEIYNIMNDGSKSIKIDLGSLTQYDDANPIVIRKIMQNIALGIGCIDDTTKTFMFDLFTLGDSMPKGANFNSVDIILRDLTDNTVSMRLLEAFNNTAYQQTTYRVNFYYTTTND